MYKAMDSHSTTKHRGIKEINHGMKVDKRPLIMPIVIIGPNQGEKADPQFHKYTRQELEHHQMERLYYMSHDKAS